RCRRGRRAGRLRSRRCARRAPPPRAAVRSARRSSRSSGSSLGQYGPHRLVEGEPPGPLFLERSTALLSEAVVAATGPALGGAELGRQQPGLLEPVQHGVEGAALDLSQAGVGEGLGDLVAVALPLAQAR